MAGSKEELKSLLMRVKESEKSQLKTTLHQREWPPSKNPQTINAGEGVKRRKPSYTAGGNVHW